MAQPPDINETFLREVDENLRRDRLHDFGKKYGKWIAVAVVLFLAASGGFIWWQQHLVQRSEAMSKSISQSITTRRWQSRQCPEAARPAGGER